MPLKIINNEQGIALLITLSVMTILIAVTMELHTRTRSSLQSTATTRDSLTLSYMAASGISLAMVMLLKDKKDSKIDSTQEDWSNGEILGKVIKDIPFEAGKIQLSITDEMSKIQVNALVKFPEGRKFNPPQEQLWDRYLHLAIPEDKMEDDSSPRPILNSLKDWLDSKDDDLITGLTGAESDYYQDLDPPYSCKNGPFTHISELTLVKGISPDLFRQAGGQSQLSNYITIYGMKDLGKNKFSYDGKININTADLPVITALLPPENADFAQPIFEYRQEMEEGKYKNPLGANWYLKCPGCDGSGIKTTLITTSSDYFRIDCSAELNETKLKISTVINRIKEKKTGKWVCKVLSWETE